MTAVGITPWSAHTCNIDGQCLAFNQEERPCCQKVYRTLRLLEPKKKALVMSQKVEPLRILPRVCKYLLSTLWRNFEHTIVGEDACGKVWVLLSCLCF